MRYNLELLKADVGDELRKLGQLEQAFVQAAEPKLDDVPDAVQARLAQADEATLLAWSERGLSATSLEEVLH